MRTIFLGLALSLMACGGGSAGEPITGTITIGYGSEGTKTPTVGAALHNPNDPPTDMFIIIGTGGGLDCGLDSETDNPEGHFVLFTVDNTAPATHNTTVSVVKSTSNAFSLNATSGTVVIDAIGAERIAGSVSFTTDDMEVGTITANGTFDVIRCF